MGCSDTSTYVFEGDFYKNTYCLPHKKSFRKKFRKINSCCLEQDSLRRKFRKQLPFLVKTVEDNIFGVDYSYKGKKIDQKFSFGELGENTIKIRTWQRRLLNKSDWTLVIDKEKEIELFETEKLASFVKKNWDLIQNNTIERKEAYHAHTVNLDELYCFESIIPIRIKLEEKKIANILEGLTREIIDSSRGLCLLNLLL